MTREQRRTAKALLVATMNQGQSWQKVVASVGLSISHATAYRLQRRVQQESRKLDLHTGSNCTATAS